MIVLAIETSGRIGSVALCRDEEVLSAYIFPEGARHARDIMPAVDRVFEQAGLDRGDADAVAVSEGPGAFTGLRVGVTFAKTLAYALGWRAVGVPSLEVAVQNATVSAEEAGRWACPVLDARRERVYGTLFEWEGERWHDRTGVLLEEPEELARRIRPGATVFGTGVRAYPNVFAEPRYAVGARELEVGRAEKVALLGLRRLRDGQDVDPMALMPRYYRLTAPEEKLQAPNGAP